ncbi:50S ribosomal protein L9 [Ruminococcaceae bacterium OttesenSCG-928-N02]|nr:50S ribosomal protein L9 [Ruminococcaceae bacterium OttesenSCG-928-N02]
MKVVLKADVKGSGKKDDVVEVSAGYARNFLFPKGLAVEANAAAMNEVKNKNAAKQHKLDVELAAAQEQAKNLEGKTFTITAKAGAGGRLFGAVTTKDISTAILDMCNENVDKRKILLDKEIKNFGTYEVEIKMHAGVSAKVYVTVKE